MPKPVSIILVTVAAGLAALGLYEGIALFIARQRTPAIVASLAAKPIHLADIAPHRLAMLEAVEDPGFRQHHGIDGNTPGSGKTTITQSLVKRLYFKRFQPGFAKIEQSLIARFVLDPALSKDEQLRAFLNVSELGTHHGRTVIGFADAAQSWFGKPLGNLSDDEWLALVAMGPAPNRLDPQRHPRENAQRVARIKRLLAGKCAPLNGNDVMYEGCA
ncbi:biosynthetic peptidoglycan transglycosylase [Polymorphobacter fuscus]|uniref:Glycosyl transferase family 51 n=1 Tax=Sandarakinorhabdus fusca TaxID=1439888 RepID=A0A7C9KVE4_9SPHN|nr:biosynthetic peptidoglycan transglycosylase [Polymorphobacter fuscus]KAB7648349.1 glycosyl transferase family 51 [Polymorphobacter fuscus]MQT15862.1 glycosyl transferase family 51 [Polymorphobacter fuscus]NJC07865.1 membrane peptidoglycan carboxypeptidase [Polymorphobacter fuscus]